MDKLYSFISKTVQVVTADELPDNPPTSAIVPLYRFIAPVDAYNYLLLVYRNGTDFCIENYPVAELNAEQVCYFLRNSDFDVSNVAGSLTSGLISGPVINYLLHTMNTVYAPWLGYCHSWPKSVRDEFVNHLERYLSSCTEVAYLQYNRTVLYIPSFDGDPVEQSKNKDLIPRLESLVVHWTRQIKELLSGVHGNYLEETTQVYACDEGFRAFVPLQDPLSEIGYWRRRSADLGSVITQLQSKPLQNAVQTLRYANSHYAGQFYELFVVIQQRTEEAAYNLEHLRTIEGVCLQLSENRTMPQICYILPVLISYIFTISQDSQYYSKEANLASLLRRAANAVVNAAAAHVSLVDVFLYDALNSVHVLLECRRLTALFTQLYYQQCTSSVELKSATQWTYDSSVVASCEAFGQRCVDLLEVCQDRLYFIRPQSLIASKDGAIERLRNELNYENYQQNQQVIKLLSCIGDIITSGEEQSQSNIQEYRSGEYLLPKFSGSQGSIIRKSIKEMSRTFSKALDALRGVRYNHLDVKSSYWHEDIATYRASVKDLTVFAENIMRTSFSQAYHSVQDSCRVLEAFSHLASRPAFRNSVNKRVLDTVRLFIDRVNQLKSQFETLRSGAGAGASGTAYTQPGAALYLNAVLAHYIYMPTKGSYALQIKRLLAYLEQDWDAITASFWLPPNTRQAAIDFLATEIRAGQLRPKDTTQSRDTQDAIEAYARAKHLFENQINLTYNYWIKSLSDVPDAPDGRKRTLDQLLDDSIIILVPRTRFTGAADAADAEDLDLTLLRNSLEVNFPAYITDAICEFDFWRYLGFYAPELVLDLYAKRNALHYKYYLVCQCVSEINGVMENLRSDELYLFKSRLSTLAKTVAPAYTSFGWNTRGIVNYIGLYRREAVEAYRLTCLFHEKAQLIDDAVKQLQNVSLVCAKPYNQRYFSPFEFRAAYQRYIENANAYIYRIFDAALDALCACYEIFRTDGEDVQREWVNYIMDIDRRVEQALIYMLIQTFEDFAFQATGRRSRPYDAQQFKAYAPEIQSIFKLQLVLSRENNAPELSPSVAELYGSVRDVLRDAISKIISRVERLPRSLKAKEQYLRTIKREEAYQRALARLEQRHREGLPTTDQDRADIMREVDEWDNLVELQYEAREPYIAMFGYLDSYFGSSSADMTFERLPKAGTNPREQLESVIGWILVYFQQTGIESLNWLNQYYQYRDVWTEDPYKYYIKNDLLNRPLRDYEEAIKFFDSTAQQIQTEANTITVKAALLDAAQFKVELIRAAQRFHDCLITALQQSALAELDEINNDLTDICETVAKASSTIDDLQAYISRLEKAKKYIEVINDKVVPMGKKMQLLQVFEADIPQEKRVLANKLLDQIDAAKRSIEDGIYQISRDKNKFRDQTQQDAAKLSADSADLRKELLQEGPFRHNLLSKNVEDPVTDQDIHQAFRLIYKFRNKYDDLLLQKESVDHGLSVFGNEFRDMKELNGVNYLLTQLKQVWEVHNEWFYFFEKQRGQYLLEIDVYLLEEQHKKLSFATRKFAGDMKSWETCDYLVKKVSEFRSIPGIVIDLTNKALRGRHWAQITSATGVELELPMVDDIPQGTIPLDPYSALFTLEFIVNSKLREYPDEINQISGGATQELKIEQGINEIVNDWKIIEFVAAPYYSKGIGGYTTTTQQYYIIKQTDDIFYKLEDHTSLLSSMKGQKFAKAFEFYLDCWENMLGQIQDSIELLMQAQRSWMYLESIFAASEDIRKQLPAESLMFDEANELWKRSLLRIYKQKQVLVVFDCTEVNSSKIQLKKQSQIIKHMLEIIETLDYVYKRLEDYLELKRSQFPRFYFLSNDELLEILAQSRDPRAVQPHIKKCFDGIKRLELSEGKAPIMATGLFGLCSEYVPFTKAVNCSGAVEAWLNGVEDAMRSTLREMAPKCLYDLLQDKLPLQFFLGKWPGQLTTSAGYIRWTLRVQAALISGYKYLLQDAADELNDSQQDQERPGMKECLDTVRRNLKNARKLCIIFLNKLTEIVRCTPQEIQDKVPAQIPAVFRSNYLHALVTNKTKSHITLEVHNRDIIEQLYHAKVTNDRCFEWLSQLKYYMVESKREKDKKPEDPYILVKQTSTELRYQYEYINNSGRLVITPLTDRCYMTITSSIEIQKGTLPQGPAGTGKTETVKDLTKGLGILCVVFNCSDGLDYKSLGRLLSGLCQAGAWSCFDEFNRLLPDVLSVVAQQVNTILQAVTKKLERFYFEGREIPLNLNCNICITMNPGYAGRSELPENLQQLFRPISMVVPDMRLISEVMIYSEGFTTARVLGQKLTSLFALCNLQLSKQSHYDWTLRSLKAILVAAGSLRRSYPTYSEDVVLMRAMQFSTEPKLIKADYPLFKGLVGDLFPGLELSDVSYGLLDAAIDLYFYVRSLFYNTRQKEKVLQLYEAKAARHGVMLIGYAGGSKTTVYEVLAAAEIRCYRAYCASCDPKSQFHNPYAVLVKQAIEAGELSSIEQFLKVVYNDHLGNDKTLSEKNFFIKTLYWFRESTTIDYNSHKVALNPSATTPEPIYDQTRVTMHDMQYPVNIEYINPKSLTLDYMYGSLDPATMEWVDGVVSNILRSTSQLSYQGYAFGNYSIEQLSAIAKGQKDFRNEAMQDLIKCKCYWIMYDGPVDTTWIESQNSVLDDSKVLTLVSGERIAFPNQISMLFEANDLDVASPATVSRCGQCYFDLNDVNVEWQYWYWVESKYKQAKRVQGLDNEVKHIVVEVLETFAIKVLRKLFGLMSEGHITQIIPYANYAIVRMFTHLFEMFAQDYNGLELIQGEEQNVNKMLEMMVIFSTIWAFGGSLSAEGRRNFDVALRELDGTLPAMDTVFEYRIDFYKKQWIHWNESVPKNWRPAPDVPIHALLVPTVDTVRTEYIVKSLLMQENLYYLYKKGVNTLAGTNEYTYNFGTLLFGVSGTGKTGIVKNIVLPTFSEGNVTNSAYELYNGKYLASESASDVEQFYVKGLLGKYDAVYLGLSAYTSADRIRAVIESRLGYRGNSLAAKGTRLLAFLDDFNMPQYDYFGSYPSLETVKLYMERGSWYKQKKTAFALTNIYDVDVLASMATPGGGRNQVSGRILSRFNIVSIDTPTDYVLKSIFQTLLSLHFQSFDETIRYQVEAMVISGIEVFNTISQTLLPTPVKPFYVFNLRDLSKFFLGIMKADAHQQTSPETITRLWVHECYRVYYDRLLPYDRQWFLDLMSSKLAQHFNTTIGKVFTNKQPPLFVDFMEVVPVPVKYGKEGDEKLVGVFYEVTSRTQLRTAIEDKLQYYNEQHPPMNLVCFADAVEHVCRIARTLSQPSGHMLLVGSGGSGRTSLARLAASIQSQEIFTIDVGKNYRIQEFKEDMKKLYFKAGGADNQPVCFLLNDNQIYYEAYLEDVNSILSSGEIPGLFNYDDMQTIREMMGPVCKAMGISDNMDSCYNLLLRRAKENLHIVLAFSPSHERFRTRLRMYPGLISSCTIDLFGEWPLSALEEVSAYFMNYFVEFKEYDILDRDEYQAKFGGAGTGGASARGGKTGSRSARANIVLLSQRVASCFSAFHDAAQQVYGEMAEQTQKKLFVTPANYLGLVRLYRTVLLEQKQKITAYLTKLQGGVGTLLDTRDFVEYMRAELNEKKAEVEKAYRDCEQFLKEIAVKQEIADYKAKQIAKDAEVLAEKKKACEATVEYTKEKLQKAEPTLKAAKDALDALNDSDIVEVRSFKKFASSVQLVLFSVMVLLKKKPDLETAKLTLNSSQVNFLQSLRRFDENSITEAYSKYLRKYTQDPNFTPETVAKASKACSSICQWVIALSEYATVYRQVRPLQEEYERSMAELAQQEALLKYAYEELMKITQQVEQLREEHRKSAARKDELKKQMEELELKLARADKLVNGLASERERWTQKISDLKVDIGKLPGDCLIASAFLSYSGSLTGRYRKILQKKWLEAIQKHTIPYSGITFNVANFLSGAATIFNWTTYGLPSDNFSAENGVLITKTPKTPFITDPQRQASRWLRRMYSEQGADGIKITNVKNPDHMKTIELAVYFGQIVILEDVTEKLDPGLDVIVSRQVVRKYGRNVMRIRDKEVEFNDNFRIYLCSRVNNPELTPELFAKCCIINFSVVKEGLTDQLLACVVSKERPELEEQKNRIVVNTAAMKDTIVRLEDEILQLLSSQAETGGSILDNEPLIRALEDSKQTSAQISRELEQSVVMERKIDIARRGYQPIAERASLLFFVLQDMSSIDFMYYFSLDSYTKLFINSITNSQQHDDISARIKILNDYHTYAVYKFCCRGLFTRHKVLLSLHICAKIMEAYGKLNMEEYMFLLRGGQIFDKSQYPQNPAPDWVSEYMWDNICVLDKLANFKNIVPAFEQRIRDWYYNYFILTEPEEAPLIGEFESSCNELQRMLILRCIRPDRLIHAVNNFISNNIGYYYTLPPAFDLAQALADSSATVPLVFILSPGTDPTQTLINFSKYGRVDKPDRLKIVALGQGYQEIAKYAFLDGVKNGNWVLLANVHLSIGFLEELEKMIDDLGRYQVHKDFRLWLSTFATNKFPIGILQNSIKITTEAPSGIRANLANAYNLLDNYTINYFAPANEDDAKRLTNAKNPQSLTFDDKDQAYRKILFGTAFFYSQLVERRKFGTLGFNIKYPFSYADFETAVIFTRKYIEQYDVIPYEAIRFIVAQIVFGGRLIDDLDRRILLCYIKELYNDSVLSEGQMPLCAQFEQYYIPARGQLQDYRDYIATLPGTDPAELFGQHNNADVFSRRSEAANLLYDILSIQGQSEVTETKKDSKDTDKKDAEKSSEAIEKKEEKTSVLSARDERIIQMAKDILANLPAEITNLPSNIDIADPNAPMLAVLCQESERYAILREKISQDMSDVQKGIRGLIGMSQHLDEIAGDLSQNRLPNSWNQIYKSTKSLAPWSRDFARRVEQIQKWANSGHPKCMWLGGLSVPTGYLTSLLQQASRRMGVAIDNLEWGFELTTALDPIRDIYEAQVPKIGEGVLVYDLYLEGAGWSIDNKCLKDSNPMELFVPMPVIRFTPYELRPKPQKYKAAFYECPVYFYPVRTGTREQPSFMLNAWLNAGTNTPDFYVKRGAALLLNLGD